MKFRILRAFDLRSDDHANVEHYTPGVYEVSEQTASHWYFQANSEEVLDEVVLVPEDPTPDAKGKGK